jgi:hypothetical protein
VRSEMRRLRALAFVAGAAAAPASAQQPPAPPPDGFHATPSLFWKAGDHRLDVGLSTRVRPESWEAYVDETDWYTGTRTRLRLSYAWRDSIFAVAELQDVRLHGMDDDGTGALASYRNANGGRSQVRGDDVRTLYLEARPTAKSFLRAGRQDIKLDSQEVQYAEPSWRYLRSARLGERLVGTVGWSHVERAYDGFAAGADLSGVEVFAFGAQPTQGVFEAKSAYRGLHDVFVGGGSVTVERGTWLANDELGVFGVYYDDERPTGRGGLADDVEVTTLGGHWLGVHPCGPGAFDALLWGAVQTGDYDGLDHLAGAGIVELGYQLTHVFAKPWLRVGVNVATGDSDPADGDHDTFFNVLPTNHLYYGFADQLAFQNLWNPFVQLRLTPHPMLALNLFVHQLRLVEDDDSRYAGSGAFDEASFGFPAFASNGHRNVGTEYDVVATFTPHRTVTIEAGFAWLDGGAVFRTAAERDVQFGYVSVELRY